MTSTEGMILIVISPFLFVAGLMLVPIIFGIISIAVGVIVFVGGLILAALSYPIMLLNKWLDKRQAEKEYEDLLQWRKDNPEIYASCRREYFNSVEGKSND